MRFSFWCYAISAICATMEATPKAPGLDFLFSGNISMSLSIKLGSNVRNTTRAVFPVAGGAVSGPKVKGAFSFDFERSIERASSLTSPRESACRRRGLDVLQRRRQIPYFGRAVPGSDVGQRRYLHPDEWADSPRQGGSCHDQVHHKTLGLHLDERYSCRRSISFY